MSPPPRRLSFAVGTSLLTASLSLGVAGCDEPTSNPGPDKANKQPEPEGPTVNQVAPPEPVAPPDDGPDPEQLEPAHVNEGPEPEPTPPPEPQIMVNPASVPEFEKAMEPKRVNTRAEDPSQD